MPEDFESIVKKNKHFIAALNHSRSVAFLGVSVPTRDLAGVADGMRTKTDRHLARMEGRYRGQLKAVPDAMVVVDQDGEIVLLNVQAERRFGCHRVLGQQVSSIIPDGSAADALAQQTGAEIELIGRRKEGSEFPIELMLSPLDSAEGVKVAELKRSNELRQFASLPMPAAIRAS